MKLLRFFVAVACFTSFPILVHAHSFGAPIAETGAPGETTCVGCHTSFALNSGAGSLALSFSSGSTYTPGTPVTITITLSDPNAMRWGFEITARQTGAA